MSARESLDAATLRAVESACAFRRDLHAASAGLANGSGRVRSTREHHLRMSGEFVRTPAELRAALDRLATEAGR